VCQVNLFQFNAALKGNAARRTMPSGGRLESVFGELERVPQGELHDSRRSLNLGKVRPLGRRALGGRIQRQSEPRATVSAAP
jgi:hypothetical protein